MFNIHKKCKQRIANLERAYSESFHQREELDKKIRTLELENSALQEHLQAMATLCAALSDLLTEEQKKAVSKKIKVKTSKKGKKDGKKAK